jgi:hypothetical protein
MALLKMAWDYKQWQNIAKDCHGIAIKWHGIANKWQVIANKCH